MTTQQIRSEIERALDEAPDSVLEQVLEYLKVTQGKNQRQLELSQQLRSILQEDKRLLEKLAR